MKYRVTEAGFIGRIVRVGEIIELDGKPPIAGLVPIDEAPPAQSEAKPAAKPKPPKAAKSAPADGVADAAEGLI